VSLNKTTVEVNKSFFVTQGQLHTSNEEDRGILYDFNMYYNSIGLERQHSSSQNASPYSMYGEWQQSPYYKEWKNKCSQ